MEDFVISYLVKHKIGDAGWWKLLYDCKHNINKFTSINTIFNKLVRIHKSDKDDEDGDLMLVNKNEIICNFIADLKEEENEIEKQENEEKNKKK